MTHSIDSQFFIDPDSIDSQFFIDPGVPSRVPVEHEQAERTVEVQHESSAIEAAAMARLHNYLRRAPKRTDADEAIARDAFVSGFQYGVRYLATQTTALSAVSNPEFRSAIALLAEAFRSAEAASGRGE